MSSRRRWAALIGVFVAGACTERTPLGPGADVIVVHAVLNAAERTQHVVVQRTSNGSTFGVAVSGATVTLTGPDSAAFSGAESVSGADPGVTTQPRYDLATGSLVAGSPYHLRVVLPSGEIVQGSSVLPAAAPTTEVTQRTLDRERDTVRLSWQRVAGARAYEVRLAPLAGPYLGAPSYVVFADTSIELPGLATSRGDPLFFPGVKYDLVVSAVDANYYEYYSHDTDAITGTILPASLEGAYGVFGALVPIRRMAISVSPP
jgi:hypothetical protein